MSKFQDEIELSDGTIIDVIVEYDGYYQPAKISGPWEDCYPEEGEVNIKVEMIGEWPEGLSEDEWNTLLDENYERLTDKAFEMIREPEVCYDY